MPFLDRIVSNHKNGCDIKFRSAFRLHRAVVPVEEAAQAAAVAMQKIANLKASKRPPVVSEWEIDYPVLTPRNLYIAYIIIYISRLIYYNYQIYITYYVQ
jgi:hypothetical protein